MNRLRPHKCHIKQTLSNNMINKISLSVLLIVLGLSSLTTIQSPISVISQAQADTLPSVWQRKLNTLLKNITISQERLTNLDPAELNNEFKAKQWKDRIDNYRQSLGKVPKADDELINQTEMALTELEKAFAAKIGEKEPERTALPAQVAKPTSPKPDSNSKKAKNPENNIRPLVSGERVRVKKLTKDMLASENSITGEGPSPFQDSEIVAQRKKSLEQFTEALKRYPQASDDDVMAMRSAYKKLAEKFTNEYKRAKDQLKIVGDVFNRLDKIENRNIEYPVPEPLQPPFSYEQAETWLTAGSKARTAAEFDSKQLQELATYAYLPEQTVSGRMARYSFRDLDRLNRNVSSRFKAVQQGYVETRQNIDRKLADLDNQVQTPTASDTKETTKRHREALKTMAPVAKSAVYLEKVLQRPTEKDQKRLNLINDRIEAYERNRDSSIDAVRMPKPKSNDPKLIAIAKEVLENPQYGFGVHGPIVLNADRITDREKETSEIDIDKVSAYGGKVRLEGTETTWTYKWKEFQFSTALKEENSDLWRIHYITAKYYTSGSETTPLNKWISGKVVDTKLIRKKHVFN